MTVTLSPVSIDCAFDAGNILLVDAGNPSRIHLNIRPDTHSGHFQWFHFKASGLTPGHTHAFSLDNASQSSYSAASVRGWATRNVIVPDRPCWQLVS